VELYSEKGEPVLLGKREAGKVIFSYQAPILSANAFACHGPDANKRESEFRLDTEEGAFRLIKESKEILLWLLVMWKNPMLYHRIISEEFREKLIPPRERNLFALTA